MRLVKLSVIGFYQSLFLMGKLEILTFLLLLIASCDSRDLEKNFYLFCQALREILQIWAFLLGYHPSLHNHQQPIFPVFSRIYYFDFKKASMQSSRVFCRQSIWHSLIIGCDAGISAPNLSHSAARKSELNSRTSPKILPILLSKLPSNCYFWQFVMIWQLPNISRSKGIQTMKFGQLIEYNMRNIFLKKSYTKYDGETIPRPFSEKSRFSISLNQ